MPYTSSLAHGPVGSTTYGARAGVAGAALSKGRLAEWHSRNRGVSIPHGIRNLDAYGNLDNLRRLTGEVTASFRGQLFADSDVYKMLEATAWELARGEEPTLREFFDKTVALIERAQRPDGYLDSAYQGHPERAPWSNFTHGHELYCLGHLIQAAVAAHRGIADDRLISVAKRFVSLVEREFGGADDVEYCGHPLIESALIELWRTTGDAGSLALAERFIRRRGSGFIGEGVYGAAYYQDDVPALEATTMRGHAVRALYLNQGITDLYLERGDESTLTAMRVQWEDMVTRRMYITGGTGSRHQDEAFGDAYELPADRAYSETCAGIALFGWAWRMYLATGDARYIDTGEIALHNVVLAGISDRGDAFSYSNPLQRRHEHVASRQEESSERLPWFSCACCPPNLMRTFASLEHYIAAAGDGGIDIANYLPGVVRHEGATITVDTLYPLLGGIRIRVEGDAPGASLRLRVPAWADPDDVTVRMNGAPVCVRVESGWIELSDALQDGTEIVLELPLAFELRHPHPRADAVRGTAAIMRGPVVYCAEQHDNVIDIDSVRVAAHAEVRESDGETDPGPLARVEVAVIPIQEDLPLYGPPSRRIADSKGELVLRPYATWGNREVGAMRVWLPFED